MANLHVNLAFSADTGKAKAQIQELQTLLSKIAYTGSTTNVTGTMQDDLKKASMAAKDLQFHLNNAFNTTTGKFDLSLLDKSLKTSGTNISNLSTQLLGAGETGQQAFMKLAQSISLADQPMLRVSKRMQDFAVTMKNTVKWQLSSSMLHGFMGAIQSAYGYAQDLNKSLTDIRIVTGYSADQMAVFAEQANKAAKSLSTTTNDYTNASLIYFQQGLTDAEVAERTAVTVKMANAAGESAQIVSDQLTAVWNNFYDGSKSLEYYADVMTALGAATASSTDEISEGLSKFAAVAETVGLSYEYATAALTTITSNTRESADVVGNALKTLFARIQGLKLGETLEDGVDLNKYSEALDKAGISIFESNGELKAMDNILIELAARWDTMSNTQQVALAQTVAGVRQYTQLIALMENWDNGDADSMMANLRTIEGAEGALDEQAEIYAQSWEAASKRVQAAAEGIYQSLLDDDFFISLNNGFANLLGGLDAFIDGAGGVKTVLTGLAGIVGTIFANQIPDALDTFKYNFEIVTKGTQVAYDRIQSHMTKATQDQFNEYIISKGKSGINKDSAIGFAIQQANELTAARNKLALVSDKMSASEKQYADTALKDIQTRQEEITIIKQKNEELQTSIDLQKQQIQQQEIKGTTKASALEASNILTESYDLIQDEITYNKNNISKTKSNKIKTEINQRIQEYTEGLNSIKEFSKALQDEIDVINEGYDILGKQIFEKYLSKDNTDMSLFGIDENGQSLLNFDIGSSGLERMVSEIDTFIQKTELMAKPKNFQAAKNEIAALGSTIPKVIQEVTGLDTIFRKIADNKITNTTDELQTNFEELKIALKEAKIESKDFEKILKSLYGKSINNLAIDMKTLESNETTVIEKTQALQNLLNNFNPGHIIRMSEAFSGLIGFLGSSISVGNSVISVFKSLGNPDLSGWEKFSTIILGISTIIPTAKAALEGLNTAASGGNQILAATNLLLGAQTGAFGANVAAINRQTAAEIANEIATKKAKGAKEEDIIATVTAKLMTQGLSTADAQAAAEKMVHAGATEFLTGALTKLSVALAWVKSHMLAVTLISAAIVATIALISSSIQKYNENIRENAEKSRESAATTKEQIKSNQKLVDSYEQTLSVYKEVKNAFVSGQATTEDLTTAQKNLADSALETATALGVEGAALAKLSGNYEQLTKDIVNAQKKDIEQGIQNEESAKNLTGNEFILDMRKGTGNVVGTTYSAYIGAGMNASDESYFQNIDYKQYDKIYGGANGLNIASLSTVEDMIQAYKEAQDIYNQALENMTAEEMNKSEIFNNLKNWLEKSSESYEAYKATEDNIQNYKVKSASLTEFEGIENAYNISNIEEYDKYASAMIENIAKSQNISQGTEEWDELTEVVHAYLSALEGVSDFATQSKAFDEIAKKTGIARDELIKYYNELTPEEQELFFSIAFNSVDNIAELDKEIELLQAVAAGQAIQVKLDVVSEGIELLDDDATTEEIVAWAKKMQEAYGEAFNLEEFLAQSSNEQLNYLRDLQSKAKSDKIFNRDDQILEYQESIQRTQENMAAQETAYQQASDDRIRNQSRLDTLEQYKIDYNKAISEGEAFDFSSLGEKEITNIDQLNNAITATEELITANDEIINSYDELVSQVDNYEQAINDLEIEKQVEEAYGWRDALKEEAEALDISYDEIQDYASQLRKNHEELRDNIKLTEQMALAEKKQAKGADDLIDNYKDYVKILKEAELDSTIKDTEKYTKTIQSLRKDLSLLTGQEEEIFTDDFINSDKVQKALLDISNGVDGATEKLKALATIQAIKIKVDKSELENIDIDLDALALELAALNNQDIEIGAYINDAPALDALANLLNSTTLTGEQMQAIFNDLGWEPEIEYVEMTGQTGASLASAGYQQYAVLNPDGSYTVKSIPLTGGEELASDTKVFLPKIKSKSKGGGYKKIDPPGNSSSKSPSGGGGGGDKTPKHAEKKSSSEKERYHTLKNQLEDLTAEYDALADASDRAFGQDKLDAIDAEIKKTDELIDKQEEYLQAIKSDLPVDKSVMTAYYNDTIGGPAIQFDENGNISNYDQIQDAMFNKYNAMTAYDEDSLEWQTFEKKYEQLEKYIEQYEETYDLLREEEANYQDLLNQRIDLELEKVEYKVEIQLEVPENQKEVIEYQLGRIEDDAKKTGEALALLTEQAEMTYDQILINKQGLNDALELSLSAAEITEVMAGNMDVLNGKTFTEDQISAIQDYKDNLLELNEEFDDIRESIEETVLEAFDMWHEKLEEGIEKFDYFGTILESYQSIIDTVGKDTLGISDSLMNTLSQASVDNAINEVEATRDAYKALQQAQIDAERELEKAKARGDEQSISFWESTLNEIQQNAEDAHEEMLSSWEEALSKIVEQFEASVQTAIDAFNEAVYQLGGIEALSEEFDRQKEMADMYLDDYQKIYELSKLNRDINNSIDDTDSLAGKQKLKKLLGEINKLQADGVKMSEYDLEYLQAEYDLRLAEIALEEAQRAKDVVRLSRDNEGNWSYVYTQNTDAVDEAQQKYEDALYAMQDLSSNYIDEISAQLIETSQEMQEALAAIRIEDYASIEEYYEEVERVQEQYQEQLALQEEELNKAIANNKELYDTDWTNYHNAVGYKISDTEEFATKFSDTLLGTLMNSESDTSNFTNILADATSTLMNELYGAAEQYYTNMAAAMEAAGTTTGTFADDLATNVDQIKQDSEEAATAVEDMATHMQEQMDNIINKVGEWQRTYGEAMNEIINANLAVIDSFNEMLATLSMDDSTVTVKYDIQNHNSDVLDAERFATGGYTGSWGNTGRLGILDEKELILNKDDTENFIEALKISRSMLNTIDLNARQASLGLGTLIPTTIKDDVKETLEQVVQITAEFPNATDHNEIEEAFNMLINRASQFANRK